MRGSNTSAVVRDQKRIGDTRAVIVWELVWMGFGPPPVTQPLIVKVRLQDTGVDWSTLRRGSRAQLGTEVEYPSVDTALVTLPYLEHPDDTLAS